MNEIINRAFVEPAQRLADLGSQVVPALLTVLALLLAGLTLAALLRFLLHRILLAVHFNRRVEQTEFARVIERTLLFRSPADFFARLAQGAVWLLTVLLALAAVDTQVTQELLTRAVAYVPDVLVAALVLLLGSLLSKFLARSVLLAAVNAQWAGARMLAGGVRWGIMGLAAIITLEQLRIGQTVLLVTFAIVFAGAVTGAAIAFGLGARDLAQDWLRRRIKPATEYEQEFFHHL